MERAMRLVMVGAVCVAAACASGQESVSAQDTVAMQGAPAKPWSMTLTYGTTEYTGVTDSSVWADMWYRLDDDWSLHGLLGYTNRSYSSGRSDVNGLDDARLGAEWRFWHDNGLGGGAEEGKAPHYQRAALRFGTTVPIGKDELSSDSWDPFVGVVYSSLEGRLGWNVLGEYQLSTSDKKFSVRAGQNEADLVTLGGGITFRAWPDDTGVDDNALFLTLDGLLYYETNGDRQLIATPGVRWEGERFGVDLGVSLPVVQELDYRPDQDWGLILGFRFKI